MPNGHLTKGICQKFERKRRKRYRYYDKQSLDELARHPLVKLIVLTSDFLDIYCWAHRDSLLNRLIDFRTDTKRKSKIFGFGKSVSRNSKMGIIGKCLG